MTVAVGAEHLPRTGYIAIDATDERQPKLKYVSWRRHLIEHEDLLRRTSRLRVRHQSTPS